MREPCPAMMFSRLYRPKFLRFSRKALYISAIKLMQHGLRSVVEFTLQLVQVALPKGRVIP